MKKIVSYIVCLSFTGISVAYSQTSFRVNGFHHVESIAHDGKYLYAADIGKELNPAAKDGDGKIYKLDANGKIIDSNFSTEILHAPKGIAIVGTTLFVADIDRLVALNCSDGKKLYEIPFKNGVAFLNDISIPDPATLYVSATDQSKIYKVDLLSKTYSELPLDVSVAGTNGLFFDKSSNRLYVNGLGSDNRANGIVGYVDLASNKFTRLSAIEGLFDGVWCDGDLLYVSNWVAFEKKGIIQVLDTKTNTVSQLMLPELISGPADFTLFNKQLIVPEMMTGTLLFINLK